METVDTLVVGAGQAGLAASYFLTGHDREHVVLERGRIGETWRSQRWDGFFLNTPNSVLRLPGFHYQGDEPDGFLALPEMIEYIEGYAESFAASGTRTRTGERTARGQRRVCARDLKRSDRNHERRRRHRRVFSSPGRACQARIAYLERSS